MSLSELAERCEQATGPDRELDCYIWAAINGYEPEWQGQTLVLGKEGVVGWIDPGKQSRNFSTNRSTTGPAAIPAYTASLDAAMSLIPDEWSAIEIKSRQARSAWIAELSQLRSGNEEIVESGRCKTAALAVCASALRARDAIAAATGTAETRSKAPCEASQSVIAQSPSQ